VRKNGLLNVLFDAHSAVKIRHRCRDLVQIRLQDLRSRRSVPLWYLYYMGSLPILRAQRQVSFLQVSLGEVFSGITSVATRQSNLSPKISWP